MGKLISRNKGAFGELSRSVPPASCNVRVPPARLDASRALAFLLVLLSGIILISTATAQTASPDSPKPPPTKTETPTKVKPAASGAKEAVPENVTPSRFVAEADLSDYVTARASLFSMKDRANDPFGQLQDPNAKRVVKTTVATPTRRIVPIQATPFADIIRLIKITIVMPEEQRFLVGNRSFKLGDRIPLSFRGKTIPVEVSAFTYSKIEFRNVENDETASIKLNRLPDGVTPGSSGSTPPGMVKDRPEAPLDLEPGNPSNPSNAPNENPKNR